MVRWWCVPLCILLSYDHRVIDGRESVLFLRTIKELIEAWMLLEV